jgi:hypothetical protein
MMPPEPSPRTAPPLSQETPAGPVPVQRPVYRWYQKLTAVLLVTFCLEIALFLLIFPWTDYWDTNYFSGLVPGLRQYWGNGYFKGVVSGLGMVNAYIAFLEIMRLRRFAKNRP